MNIIKRKIAKYIDYKIDISIRREREEIVKLKKQIDHMNKNKEESIRKKINNINKDMLRLETKSTLSSMTIDGVWFYSLMKSGTTYTINFLFNYLNIMYNKSTSPLSKKDMISYHSVHNKIKSTLPKDILDKQEILLSHVGYKSFIHTHYNIHSFADKNIFILRNPLDYIVSKYFYMYKDRGHNDSLDNMWKILADEFVLVYCKQAEIASEKVLCMRYEDIIDSSEQFKCLLEYLNIPFDNVCFDKALLFSSKEYLKKMEDTDGAPILASKLNRKSFIRSGKIGDWKSHIDEKLKIEIITYLVSKGVDVDDFKYE